MQAQNLSTALNQTDDEMVDLRQLWRVVRQSWKSILGLSIIVSMLAALWVMRIDPVYRASATIMIESQEAKMLSIDEVYGMPSRMREYFLTQFEIIKNRDIAEMVADEMDLWNNPAFISPRAAGESNGLSFRSVRGWVSGLFSNTSEKQVSAADIEEQRKAAVVNKIMSHLYVQPVEFTQLVVVSFESTDRQLAAEIVNTLARVYIQSQMDAKLQSTRDAGDWLSSRLVDLKANLDASQQALQSFRDKEHILDVVGGQALSSQELNQLNARLVDARRTRMRAENLYKALGGSANYSVDQLMNMPAVLQLPLVQSLAQSRADAQQEVTNLARRYGPEHPKMMAATARENSVSDELRQQVLQAAAGIESEYRLALSNEEDLEQQLAAVKGDVATLNRKEFELQELQKQVEIDQRLYEMFFTRAKETSQTIGFQAAHARVVEKAIPPISPIKPDKSRTVMIAFVLSCLAGVGLAILQSLLDNTLRSTDDVIEKLDAPLLGVLPSLKMKKGHVGPCLGYLEDPKSGFSEAVRSIRTGLVLSGLEKPHKITVITSTTPGEGKSTIAINLAAALALVESVLLIDADLRRPSLAGVFKLPSGTPGLSNVLAQSETLEACLHKSPYGFDVLPAGIIPANPLEMLSTARFKELLISLSGKYDRVIIDSAPMNAVSDALILATMADSLVYVAKADSTPYALVLKSINTIRHSNLPLTGVVLNGLDTTKQDAYGKYGNYDAYHSYGQS
jgi:capsular exopolysaccharide synthesis family protein